MRRLLFPALLVLVACSTAPDEAVLRTPAPATSAPATSAPATSAPATSASPSAPATGCANEATAAADASLRTGEPRSGDVDGDGEDDSVATHLDPTGEPGCQGFVVVESAAGTAVTALATWRTDFGLPAPTINTLEEVDGEPGLEVVVNMGAGASAQFVGLVTVDDGVLQQVATEAGDNSVGEGLLGFGGSIGHLEAVDCAPGGGIVSSFAAPHGSSYRIERRFLVFEGPRLVEDRVEVEDAPLEEIDRFPEYRASPFGSCSG